MMLFGSLLPLVVLGGLVFVIVQGFRSIANSESEPVEPAEAAKSFALHLGLFVALIACAVGLIDLLQALFENGDRLAGSSSDLARGLSLLIVAGPAYWLLLRAISRRATGRVDSGDSRAMRGWTVYLVVALATTLVALLISVGQVANDLTSANRDVDLAEVAQLVVWLGLWLTHWFGLRPQFGVRGDAHLAFGTTAGLLWLLSGLGAVTYRVLESGYDAIVGAPLESSFDTTLWLVVSATGGVVWMWHWLAVFDAPAPGSPVEGARRGSSLWFFTVVVAGILPGLVAMLVTVTTMVSGVLIWFVGTTDQEAADFFRPGAVLVAALFVGFVAWAYHRWVLDAHGLPAVAADHPEEEVVGVTARNEAIRFHDYVVVTLGLVAVVGAAAALVALAINTIADQPLFAGSSRPDNVLIVIVTVLGVGAGLWWHYWGIIETARSAQPVAESDSFWRKLYLIASFGLGGLVLGVALIWVLFAFLRDLIDGALGRQTIEDLANPIGWAVAVVGAVWYHFGVWQTDRAVLEARQPPPPTAPNLSSASLAGTVASSKVNEAVGLSMRPATSDDAGELFTLQRADQTSLSQEWGEPMETFAEMVSRLAVSDTTIIADGHRIIGFVAHSLDPSVGSKIQAVIAPDRNTPEIVGLLASASSPRDPTS